MNAACREQGISYSRFVNGLKKANVSIDRKMLADMAVHSVDSFKRLVDLAKTSLS